MSFNFNSLAGIEEQIYGHNEVRHEIDPKNGGERLIPTGGHAEHSIQGDRQRIQRFRIDWQDGPVDRSGEPPYAGVNGAFVEDVLEVCRRRLERYEASSFACAENVAAIKHIESALVVLQNRRNDRRGRGVEGQNKS